MPFQSVHGGERAPLQQRLAKRLRAGFVVCGLLRLHSFRWSLGLFNLDLPAALRCFRGPAAQLFDAARRAQPDLPEQIARGDLSELDAWLDREVWGRGCLLETPELIQAATGAPLGTGAFERHLRRRYLSD